MSSPLEDGEFRARATIGVALAPGSPGGDPLERSYEAMRQARREGVSCEIYL